MSFRRLIFATALVHVVTATIVLAQTGALSTNQQVLTGREWRLVSFGRIGAEAPVINDAAITIVFDHGRVSGSGGCNSYSGTYKVEGDRISFGPLASTKRACLESATNQQETRYLSSLPGATRFRVSPKQLIIYVDKGQSLLNFANEAAPDGSQDQPADDPISVLNDYYQAINAKDYRRAYSLWETPSQTLQQFIRGFADTKGVRLLVDPAPQIEGAAGSSFASIGSLIISTLKDGRERVFVGCYVMRKSNVRGEEGPNQKGWRIYRASLVPASGSLTTALDQKCR